MDKEQSFGKMWMDARLRFKEKTKRSLNQPRIRSLDEVLADLKEHLNIQDLQDGDKRARIEALITNVLQLIQLLGGVTAQSASIVFGPANLCFNALSFLMNVPTKVAGFYDNIVALFEEISSAMKEFWIYRRLENYANIDLDLKESIHKIMIAFVDICAISIDILGGRKLHTSKTLTKLVLFEDDSDIQAKLDEFKKLIDDQILISNGVTLEHVLKARHDLSTSSSQVFIELNEAAERSRKELQRVQRIQRSDDDVLALGMGTENVVEDASERGTESRQRESMKGICEKLAIPLESAAQRDSLIKPSNVSGTGSWLENIDAFKKWADPNSDLSQLLLSGNRGSGKSHLASSVLKRFNPPSTASGGDSTTMASAVYCFSNIAEIGEEARDAVKESLKYMAVQLARSDNVYREQMLAPFLDSDAIRLKDMSVPELFRNLFIPSSASQNSKFARLLLFEDVDQLNQDDALTLFNAAFEQSTTGFRVIMTGTDGTFESCQSSHRKSINSLPLIRVQEHNEPDIKTFIEQELLSQELFPTDIPGALKIVEEIRKNLPDVADGNFSKAAQIIEKVSNAVMGSEMSEDEIIRLISVDSLKQEPNSTVKSLEELNHTLTAQEIEQLNVILAWVVYGDDYLSINELVAALFLHTGKPLLQNLKIKIRRKYDKILQITGEGTEDEFVKIKSESFVEYFNRSKRERPIKIDAEEDKRTKISMTIKLDHVSVSQAQRFFWDLSEKVVTDKFVSATAAAISKRSLEIGANKVDSKLLIVKSCFEVLLDENKEEPSALGHHATNCLFTHLEELLKETNGTEASERAEIVDNLIDVFQNPTSWEKYFYEELLGNGGWLHHELAITQKWLADSEAAQLLDRKQQGWLKKANASDMLFPIREMATMIARQWLCDRSSDPQAPYYWIHVFLLRQEEIHSRKKKVAEDGVFKSQIDSNEPNETEEARKLREYHHEVETASTRIEQSARWAVASAGLDEDSHYYERLGKTYLAYEKTDLAIETLLKAKKLPDSSWQLCQCLADAYAQKGQTKLALEEMEASFTFRRTDHELGPSGTVEFVEDLIKTAEWHVKSGNIPGAVAKLDEATRCDEHYYKSYYELFKLLNSTKQGPEATKVLVDMSRAPAARHEGLTKLGSMLLEYSKWIGNIGSLEDVLQTIPSHDAFDPILSALRNALDFAANKNMDAHVIDLHLIHGLVLASASRYKDHTQSALDEWGKCLQMGIKSEKMEIYSKAIEAATCIFNHYFSQALAAQESSNADTDDYRLSIKKMEDIAERACIDESLDRPLRLSLASFYTREGKQEKARDLLVSLVREGIDWLAVGTSYSTTHGYEILAHCLMHTGDDLNALSAWCLCGAGRIVNESELDKLQQGPNGHEDGAKNAKGTAVSSTAETEPAAKDTAFVCSGGSEPLTYSDRVWFCTVCPDVALCEQCLEKVQKGTLSRRVCAADHQWLLVASWLDEFNATGRGRVRVGGELRDGKREGGRVVSADEWFDMVKQRWNLPTRE